MSSAFQWLIAARYLKMVRARSLRLHRLTLVLAILLAAVVGAEMALGRAHAPKLQEFRILHEQLLKNAALILLVALVLIGFFLELVRRFTIFTAISIFGLFLGSAALVIVLSVMSGFETDLKHKILGSNAHVVVTNPDHPFTDSQAVRARIEHLSGVVGVTPFISNEVMIASASNLSGVVLKGIDPHTASQVTDLKRNLDLGDLDYLDHPEKLRELGGPPILRDDAPGGSDFVREVLTPKEREILLKDTRAAAQAAAGDDQTAHYKAGDAHGKALPEKVPPSASRRTLPGVIIGRELAKNLRLYPGDDVSIISPLGGIGPSGPIPKSKPFRVAGIFFSGMYEYDNKYIYLAIPDAQRFLDLPGQVTGIELKVSDPDHSERVVAAIKRALGDANYDVEDWKELNRSLFSALKLEKIAMFVVLCFIILVAAFSIIANGIMLVMEKGREIAILKSMGASDRMILIVFLILGLYMGSLGTAVGIGVGIATCLALGRFGLALDPDVYYITQLPVKMNPYEIVLVFVAALLIALCATLYPAWVGARLRPVEALRE